MPGAETRTPCGADARRSAQQGQGLLGGLTLAPSAVRREGFLRGPLRGVQRAACASVTRRSGPTGGPAK